MSKPDGKKPAPAGNDGKPSFFTGLGRGILFNLPLLIGGVVMLVIGLVSGNVICRLIAYSLFIAYCLSFSFQAVYTVSSKALREENGEERPKPPQENERKTNDDHQADARK